MDKSRLITNNYAMQKTERSKLKNLNDHPYLFGHFLNMARHNAYIILNDLYEKLECTHLNIAENLLHHSLGTNYNELTERGADWERRLSKGLKRKFPFLTCPIDFDKKTKKNREPMGKAVVNKLSEAIGE